MNNSKRYFRLLFALQLAFLPLIIFGQIMHQNWLPLMFFVGIFVFRLWSEAFINRVDKQDFWVICICDAVVVTFCSVFVAATGRVSAVYPIIVLVVNLAFLAVQLLQFGKARSDVAIAFDFSFRFFAYVGLLLAFIPADINFWVKATMLSAILVGVADLGYKLYTFLRQKYSKKKHK